MRFPLPKLHIPTITLICLSGLIVIEPSPYLLLIGLSIFIHEGGHLLTMWSFRVGVEKITLLPIGIDIKRREKFISYPKEIMISLSGAIANLFVFLFFRKHPFFAYTNLLYAIINLLPIKGLDGGFALEALLFCFCPPHTAQAVIKALSVLFCLLLWMTGVYILFILNGNISIFALSVFLFISINMK